MHSIDPNAGILERTRTRQRFNLAILGSIMILTVLLAGAALSTHEHSQTLSQARQRVLHTYEVVRQLDALLAAPNDAESAAYGLLLTQNPQYLKDYQGTGVRAFRAFDETAKLTLDNPTQQQRLKELKPVLDSKFQSLNEIIKLQPKADPQIRHLLQGSRDRESMEKLRHIVAKLKLDEERLLQMRLANLKDAASELTNRLVLYALVGLVGFATFALVVRFLLTRNEREQRLQSLLYQLSQQLSSKKDASLVIPEVLGLLGRELGYELVQFWAVDEEKNCLVRKSSWSSRKCEIFEAASAEMTFALGVGVPGRVWQSKNIAWVNDVVQDANFPRAPYAKQDNLHGAIAFPLLSDEGANGVVELLSEVPQGQIDADIAQVLSVIGAQLAQYVEKNRIETALLTSERKFRAIFDQTFELIGLLSPEGILLEANKTALDMGGISRQDVIGKNFWDTPWWSHSPAAQAQLQQAIQEAAGGKLVRFESEHPTPDGSMVQIDFSVKPVADDSGKVVLLIPEGRDISHKKEAEKRVSEFYSTVSHELRTPLTSIRGAFGLLEGGKAGELSPRAKQLVSMGRAESERLVRLINDILDVRKIEAGKLELKIESLNPMRLIESTVETLATLAAEAQVELVRNVSDDVLIKGDRDRLVQVLTNLVSNALKFSPKGSQVIIDAKPTNNAYRIEVTDQGSGIKTQDIRKLFQMFQQIDSSDSREKGGTGLGLAISKAIVEQHGGSIGVESDFGKGATFWFEVPLAAETAVEKSDREKSLGNILLVEDDDNIASVISMNLNEHGFDVVRVATIKDTEQRLASGQFTAMVLDIRLPDGSGTALMDKLQASASARLIPIVVVSAAEQNGYSNPLLIDWITKPFEERRLLGAVEQAIRGRRRGPARVLIVEDDDATREIIRQHVCSLSQEIECFVATDGQKAIELTREKEPDLIILDLGLPNTNGFEVVTVLRHEKASRTPLVVYTANDLTAEEKNKLTLGLTQHFTKSRTSEATFIQGLVELLNGLLPGKHSERHG